MKIINTFIIKNVKSKQHKFLFKKDQYCQKSSYVNFLLIPITNFNHMRKNFFSYGEKEPPFLSVTSAKNIHTLPKKFSLLCVCVCVGCRF